MANPLVSICIPTYNRAGMISKAIESALDQSYLNIEVLVVDNASQDNIELVIAKYNDMRLKFYKNNRNLGMYGNFNRCIELSQGKYIHILHSDDYIDSYFTEKCVNFMESHPSVMMTCGSAWYLSNNEPIKVRISDHDIIYPAPEGFRKILGDGIPIICPSVMIKRDVYDSIGLFSCEYPYAGDFYQWLRISRIFDFAYIADAILFYRQGIHSESFHLLQKIPLGYLDWIKIYSRIIEEIGDDVASYHYELNLSIRRHMDLCINTGIWRSSLMKSYSPLFFIGFALALWTLILPNTNIVRDKKIIDLLSIFIISFLLLLPGGHYCLKTVYKKPDFLENN